MHPNSSLFSNGKNIDPSSLAVRVISLPKKVLSYYVNSYVGISHFIQKTHCENGFFKNAKQNVIYNSVPVVNTPYTSSIKKRIGFIGRLSAEKGFDIFCELAAHYKDSAKFQFLAAGSFPNKESDNLLKELSIVCNVELLGFVNLSDFLSQVDIVFLPIKWHEPFGRVVAECVFAGKIVYTTPVGGISELSKILPNVIIANDIVQEFNNTCETISVEKIDPSLYKSFDKKLIAEKYLAEYIEMLKSNS
jgi:glycosyltransferase involved in cell wall biosynthesis